MSSDPAAKDPAAPRLFCFGLGYTAEAMARHVMARGWRVAGTTRSPDKAARLSALGIETFIFNHGQSLSDPAAALAGTTHLLVSVPADAEGDPVADRHGAQIAAIPKLAWAGYLSTTGVYGNRNGGWVDEDSELLPTGERGRMRVAAERAWLDLRRREGLPIHIFRLAGIYGPGRNALESVKAGIAKRINKPGQVFSRIHVEDILRVLMASIAKPHPGRIYNVCDDNPAPPAEVIDYACGLLDVPPPALVPLEEAQLSPMGRSFYRDNKRVSNSRIKEELAVDLRYPDYRAGLVALLLTLS